MSTCLKERVKLSSVMDLNGCHRCSTGYPLSSMTVDMIVAAIRPEFHGIFDITIHATVCRKGRESVLDHTVDTSFEVIAQTQQVNSIMHT